MAIGVADDRLILSHWRLMVTDQDMPLSGPAAARPVPVIISPGRPDGDGRGRRPGRGRAR